jgi:hypothetical protein
MLKCVNKMIGEVYPGELNVICSVTGGFKSTGLYSLASDYIREGKKVLFITLEVCKDRVKEYILSNLNDIDIELIRSGEALTQPWPEGQIKLNSLPAGIDADEFKNHVEVMLEEFNSDVVIFDFVDLIGGDRNDMLQYLKLLECVLWTASQKDRHWQISNSIMQENSPYDNIFSFIPTSSTEIDTVLYQIKSAPPSYDTWGLDVNKSKIY